MSQFSNRVLLYCTAFKRVKLLFCTKQVIIMSFKHFYIAFYWNWNCSNYSYGTTTTAGIAITSQQCCWKYMIKNDTWVYLMHTLFIQRWYWTLCLYIINVFDYNHQVIYINFVLPVPVSSIQSANLQMFSCWTVLLVDFLVVCTTDILRTTVMSVYKCTEVLCY